MTNIDTLRKINKNVINDNGTITSFDKQLIQLMSGVYDTSYPMIINVKTDCLKYVNDLNEDNILIMRPSTAIKIREKHDIGYEFVSNTYDMLKNSVLAFSSPKENHESSIVCVLDEVDDEDEPIIAILRKDKKINSEYITVNEVTSIYDRNNLINYINKSYNKNCVFYTNEKTKQYFKPNFTQLEEGLKNALFQSKYRLSFTKSQVEKDLATNKNKSRNITERMNDAKAKTSNQQHKATKTKNIDIDR